MMVARDAIVGKWRKHGFKPGNINVEWNGVEAGGRVTRNGWADLRCEGRPDGEIA